MDQVEIVEIMDTDMLYRRFSKLYLRPNGTISPGAFSNTSDTKDMSVELARLTTPQETVKNYPDFGVASFPAGLARNLNQEVFHDPDLNNNNYAHSTVRGHKPDSIKNKLAKGSLVVKNHHSH